MKNLSKFLERMNSVAGRISVMLMVAVMACTLPSYAGSAMSAGQLAAKAAAKLSKAGGISATFIINGPGGEVKGSLKSAGRKFALVTPQASSWYDGRNLYNYNSAVRETTLIVPDAAELAESNPLTYVASAADSYICSYARKQTAGSKTLVLKPKRKGSNIRGVVLKLDSATLAPVSMVLTLSDGSRTVVKVTSYKTGVKHAAATFDYPRKRYPKVKVIDLR